MSMLSNPLDFSSAIISSNAMTSCSKPSLALINSPMYVSMASSDIEFSISCCICLIW
uniref:Uncharacterized protein n=1 Tax=uncultured marine virus TaxID=186617 RepID=A0A0F7LAS6_9VIRU|nr:hypothetical protein [uncultured marine virus]